MSDHHTRPRARLATARHVSPVHGMAIVLIAIALFWAALGLALIGASPAPAFDARQNNPGAFDFYVLALSWSPSFCASAQERGRMGKSTRIQCGGRPYSFVVHGLWPQYERGFPEYCQRPAPRVSRRIVSRMLDLMPAPGLIFNEWDKHGVCSGLSPEGYFELTRKARAAVKIPDDFVDPPAARQVSPDEVEAAFVKANPGLTREAIAVVCDRRRLSEVRICFDKTLGFRSCAEVDRRACRQDRIAMPPARGR